jgi:hypothetical protein
LLGRRCGGGAEVRRGVTPDALASGVALAGPALSPGAGTETVGVIGAVSDVVGGASGAAGAAGVPREPPTEIAMRAAPTAVTAAAAMTMVRARDEGFTPGGSDSHPRVVASRERGGPVVPDSETSDARGIESWGRRATSA